jgi:alkylation response protein AidB-like acyl-CoA dehydrogenase
MYIDLEGSRLLTYQSAWMIDQGNPCDKEVAMAKSWASRAYREITAKGMQIHGAIAFSREHNMQLYYKHAKSAEISFGDARFQRKIIAKIMEL